MNVCILIKDPSLYSLHDHSRLFPFWFEETELSVKDLLSEIKLTTLFSVNMTTLDRIHEVEWLVIYN